MMGPVEVKQVVGIKPERFTARRSRGSFPCQVFATVAKSWANEEGFCKKTNTGDEKKLAQAEQVERARRLHLDACFSCFDVLERGRVPSGLLWGGLALMTGAGDLSKIKFVVSMYDADR